MKDQPLVAYKRIDLLDVYRGFAILGIFVVNIVIMNSTFLNQDQYAQQWTSSLDLGAERILQLFFYTKFFPIFSLLFGLGISMQALKLYEKGQSSFFFFLRRMAILFIIGVMHIVFLWSGDVLNLYAILGLFATFMIKKSNKVILSLSGFFLFFPFFDQILAYLLGGINFQPATYLSEYTGQRVNEVIRNGSYLEGVQLRILEYLSNISMLFGFLAPVAISMFLLGVYIGKNKIYQSLDLFIQKIKRPLLIITIISNLYRIIFLFVLPSYDVYYSESMGPLFIKLMVISDVIMGLFYLWLIGWLWYNTKWKAILSPLKHVGRMALTNYILQSFIGLILFSSVGFRLYETLSPSETLCTAVVVFIGQVILSKIWLTYFQFGPLEWLWRCFTYAKRFPIKRKTIN